MAGIVPFDRVELDLAARPHRIHLLGIGGAGMSAIAMVLHSLGHEVSGTDRADSAAVEALRAMGIRVEIGHRADNLGDAEFVGVSTAVRDDNPEVVAARARNIPVMHRYDLLAAIGATRSTLSVSGTHGKTTTSALLALIATECAQDPSYIIGSSVAGLGSGARLSAGPWLVLEADESDSTFLAPPRAGAIVTNIEADHLDHHGTWDDLVAAFERFVVETSGPVVVCADDPGSALLVDLGPRVISYGAGDGAAVQITDERIHDGGSAWTVRLPDDTTHGLWIALPGHHLVLNATAAFGLAWALEFDPQRAAAGVARYRGAGRRFEERGNAAGVRFVDDYAHMPTEVRAVLSATASQRDASPGSGRVVAVFQPHRYSRTAAVYQDYAGAFDDADVVVITEIYAAGEAPVEGVDGSLVLNAVRTGSPELDVRWMATRAELVEGLEALLRDGDLCLTMGAGDLTTLADEVISALGGPT